ncbi:hypothetical protein F5Y17DRAFT_428051 [Xylariaceae sp. FL0594]|nr:hypothetical protein F5Y17DRAFT_428051 [Xylariaceae sp. FL0594]
MPFAILYVRLLLTYCCILLQTSYLLTYLSRRKKPLNLADDKDASLNLRNGTVQHTTDIHNCFKHMQALSVLLTSYSMEHMQHTSTNQHA